MPRRPLRVFVSSTSEDLALHRQVVREAVVEYGHVPVMMQDFGAIPGATVAACCDLVRSADLVIALCAFRRGWVPTAEQGGDGDRSVTALEVAAADAAGVPVYLFLAHEASWPGSLYERDPAGQDWVRRFRAGLNRPAYLFHPGPVQRGRAEPDPTPEFGLAVRKALLGHVPDRPPVGGAEVVPAVVRLLAAAVREAGPPVPADRLRACYLAAAPVDWDPAPPAADPVGAARAYAADLARAPRQSDGSVPLLGFVRAVAAAAPAGAGPLLDWARGPAADLGEAAPKPAPSPAPAGGHLLVSVQPTATDPGRYAVKAWLAAGRRVTCLAAGEQAYPWAEVPAAVDRIRTEATYQAADPTDVWVEFILPRERIAERVDQWPVTVDVDIGENPIGAEHPVVVRVADRYTKPVPVAELRKRAARLREAGAAAARLVDGLPAADPGPGLGLRVARADAGGVDLCNKLRAAPAVVWAVLPGRRPGRPPGRAR